MGQRRGLDVQTKKWASIALAGGVIAAVTTVSGTAQAATQTLNIQVGGDTTVSGVGFEGMRFLAPTLKVHKGDVLNFAFAGFHTATLIPANVGATDWRQDNATGLTAPWSLVVPDQDDGASTFQLNGKVAFGSQQNCGTAAAPCDYSGNAVVNSGLA